MIKPKLGACPRCSGKLHMIGDGGGEMLDVVSAVLRVKRIHRPRYGCPGCEGAVGTRYRPALPTLSPVQLLLEMFKPWLLDRLSEISAKSNLVEVIRHTLGHRANEPWREAPCERIG